MTMCSCVGSNNTSMTIILGFYIFFQIKFEVMLFFVVFKVEFYKDCKNIKEGAEKFSPNQAGNSL